MVSQSWHRFLLCLFGLFMTSRAVLLDVRIIAGKKSACPDYYYKVDTDDGLNGDLNQGAGGADVYLCIKEGDASGSEEPINDLFLMAVGSASRSACGSYHMAKHNDESNGDLNQGAGGPYIYLCYGRGNSHPLDKLYLTQSSDCKSKYIRTKMFGKAYNGDLNYDAGGKDIFLCQSHACVAKKVSGEWKPMYTIPAPTEETWMHGTSKTHSSSKTDTWSKSVTATVSSGFDVKGVTGSAEVSGTLAHETSKSYSDEWSSSEQETFKVKWEREDVGKMSWQFSFTPSDSCGHTEQSLTKEKALTEGRWRLPCCLPGYSTDAPLYTTCWSAAAMLPGARSPCKVASTSELSEYLSASNRTQVLPPTLNENSRQHGSADVAAAVTEPGLLVV